jgi:hypothetical protein
VASLDDGPAGGNHPAGDLGDLGLSHLLILDDVGAVDITRRG